MLYNLLTNCILELIYGEISIYLSAVLEVFSTLSELLLVKLYIFYLTHHNFLTRLVEMLDILE